MIKSIYFRTSMGEKLTFRKWANLVISKNMFVDLARHLFT